MTNDPALKGFIPWPRFSRDYAGFGFTAPRPRGKTKTTTRRDPGPRRYYLTISPPSGLQMIVSTRKVGYRSGLRLVYWLRSRGHRAFMY